MEGRQKRDRVRGDRWLRLLAYACAALGASCLDPEPEAPPAPAGAVTEETLPAIVDEVPVVAPASAPLRFDDLAPRYEPRPSPPVRPVLRPRPTGTVSVEVDVAHQRLTLRVGGSTVRQYPVSTSRVGTGSQPGSLRTPLGRHRVAEVFGAGAPPGTVFRSRASTGQIARIHTDPIDVEEDLVLTRILWLEGLEPGQNRGPGVDSKQRYIYIHGTNEEGLIGARASHGCVRMRNADVVELFDLVPVGTEVMILDSSR